MVRLSAVILFILFAVCGRCAASEDTRTQIFHPSFKSLQVKIVGNDQLPAVLIEGTDNFIEIEFDELGDQRRYMRYSLVHCNSNWKPDGLIDQMFVDGFNEWEVEEYEHCGPTTVHYVHYRIVIPNQQIRLKVSGNYLLRVYDEDNRDETILQARFSVCEATAGVGVKVDTRTDVDYNKSHQQLEINVDTRRAGVFDPYRDLRVTVMQNSRPETLRTLGGAMRVSGPNLFFEHVPELIFDGGNEYRRFETITLNYPGMKVDEMRYAYPMYHARLIPDGFRSEGSYVFDKTQHGRYRVREFNSDNSDVEADYVLTHFSLEPGMFGGKEVYVEGDLANRKFDSTNRMVYNPATGMMECTMLLKQGSYNYQYVVKDSRGNYSAVPVEGSYYQTNNEYTVMVYYHKPGELYDRLIGFANVKTFK